MFVQISWTLQGSWCVWWWMSSTWCVTLKGAYPWNSQSPSCCFRAMPITSSSLVCRPPWEVGNPLRAASPPPPPAFPSYPPAMPITSSSFGMSATMGCKPSCDGSFLQSSPPAKPLPPLPRHADHILTGMSATKIGKQPCEGCFLSPPTP